MNDTMEERQLVGNSIMSLILRCEKIHPKFMKGSAQHTLLKNRIFALQVAKSITLEENVVYTQEEIDKVIPPLTSILYKCKKAQAKYVESSSQYKRFEKQIELMEIVLSYINIYKNKREL